MSIKRHGLSIGIERVGSEFFLSLKAIGKLTHEDYETITPASAYTAFDGFTDETGVVNPAMPRAHQQLTFAEKDSHTLVQTVITYKSPEDLQKVIDMGMEQGLTSTLERLDELLEKLTG